MSVQIMNPVKHSLEHSGERVVSFDLIQSAFPADALDNKWPSGVRQKKNAFARNIVELITLS